MDAEHLHIEREMPMREARLVLGLSGWMDGGEVSTGVARRVAEQVGAVSVARIDPAPFYLLNLPGSMDVAAMVRPHVQHKGGRLRSLAMPQAEFLADPATNTAVLLAREPNLNWPGFADGVFAFAERFDVREVYFIGSYAGLAPHTRPPRLSASASDDRRTERLAERGIRLSDYEGPAGIASYLLHRAADRSLSMTNLVAEVPAYVEGPNPSAVEAVLRTLAGLLDLAIDFSPLREAAEQWERRVSDAVADHEELAEQIHRLEADYDDEVFHRDMDDLKQYLRQRGVRPD